MKYLQKLKMLKNKSLVSNVLPYATGPNLYQVSRDIGITQFVMYIHSRDVVFTLMIHLEG